MKKFKSINQRSIFRLAVIGVATISFALLPARVSAQTVGNSGFEVPDLGGSVVAFEFDPTETGVDWTFTPSFTGIAANSNVIFVVTGAANGNSDGTTSTAGQAAFIQETGSISQDISGFSTGTATISFSLEGRGGGADDGFNPIDVIFGGTDLGDFTPTSSSSFTTFTTDSVDVTAGTTYSLDFVGVGNPAPTVERCDPTAVPF